MCTVAVILMREIEAVFPLEVAPPPGACYGRSDLPLLCWERCLAPVGLSNWSRRLAARIVQIEPDVPGRLVRPVRKVR